MLWRHGRTEWNSSGRFQGQLDIGLDDVGRAQAERAAGMLAALDPAAIVSSDLSRAAATAAPLARLTGLEVGLDPRLREVYAGEWQGLGFEEIDAKYPDESRAWSLGEPDARPPGGESRREAAERGVAALRAAADLVAPGETVVAVTHGGTSRVAMAALVGLPEAHWAVLGGLSNCCWSVLHEGRAGWRLVEHNAGTLPEPVLGEEG